MTSAIATPDKLSHTWRITRIYLSIAYTLHTTIPLWSANSVLDPMFPDLEPDIPRTKGIHYLTSNLQLGLLHKVL